MSAGPRCAMMLRPFAVWLVLALAAPAQAQPGDGTLRMAREAAAAEQHARAIELYRGAFSAEPDLADTYAHELGFQLTWNDQPHAAIPWFERRLETAPVDLEARLGLARALSWDDQLEAAWFQYRIVYYLDPGNVEALRGEARMLAWMDRLDASVEHYDSIVDQHPEDIQARIERAQVINWRGEHFRAARLYEEILADDPGNPEAMVGLAQALRWSGQDRQAMMKLDPIQNTPAAAPVYRDLQFAARPLVELSNGWSDDNDDLEVFGNELSWTGTSPIEFLNRPRTRLGLLHERLWQPGQPDVENWGLNFGGSGKTSLRTTLNAYFGLRRFTSDGPISSAGRSDDLSWTLPTWDAWWTWLARHDVRVDFASDRNYVQTPRSLGYETSLTQFGVSADWRVVRDWTLSGLVREGFYSDDNRRTSALVRARWQRDRDWVTWVSPRLSAFWISEPQDRGYWNPEDFFAAGIDAGVSRSFAEKWTPRLEVSTAREWEEGEGYGVFAISGGLLWRITRQWELDLGAGTSDSRLNTSSGYARDWASLSVRWRY
jgi:tetratricopeptide (TPR) repeat protein